MIRETEQGFYHSLNQGEDIWLLAELYYGDASLWWVIYHANSEALGDDPEYGLPGLEIFVPYIEVKDRTEKVPEFISLIAADPSFDPMTLLARDYYNDPTLCFDIYESNGWDQDKVPQPGADIRYPATATRPAIRRAERWRAIFYRE